MTELELILFFFSLPFIFMLLYKGNLKLRNHLRWKKAKDTVFQDELREVLSSHFLPYNYLTEDEREKLELKIKYFLLFKRIEGLGDLQINEMMKVLIAANACLMLINLNFPDIYKGLKNIFVLSGSYVERVNPVNPYTGVPIHLPRQGESWKRGPIILSWESINYNINFPQQKSNLIIHEFAHHLDQQDGYFDGTPKLRDEGQYNIWFQIMAKEFRNLKTKVLKHIRSDIDAYGATNEAEFFAVCTEYFFSDPVNMNKKHPDIFNLFQEFFNIDPRRWHGG